MLLLLLLGLILNQLLIEVIDVVIVDNVRYNFTLYILDIQAYISFLAVMALRKNYFTSINSFILIQGSIFIVIIDVLIEV